VSHLARLVAQAVADAGEREKLPLPFRGFASAAISAQGLIAEMNGEPVPGRHPSRVWIRRPWRQAYDEASGGGLRPHGRAHFGGSSAISGRRGPPWPAGAAQDFIVTEFRCGRRAPTARTPSCSSRRLLRSPLAPALGTSPASWAGVPFESTRRASLPAARACEPDLLG